MDVVVNSNPDVIKDWSEKLAIQLVIGTIINNYLQ